MLEKDFLKTNGNVLAIIENTKEACFVLKLIGYICVTQKVDVGTCDRVRVNKSVPYNQLIPLPLIISAAFTSYAKVMHNLPVNPILHDRRSLFNALIEEITNGVTIMICLTDNYYQSTEG